MTNTSNMEYTPKAPAPTQLAPSYELKKDVTGKPPEKRGETLLTDKNGNHVKVPYPPIPSCRKCYGRGFTGYRVSATSKELNGRLVICTKCYPMARG